MKRLMLDGPRALRWEDIDEPALEGSGQALVRPIAVATCDIDPAVLQGRFPLAGPYPFGHEGVAEVVAVGADVTAVRPGDRVVVPFQISCGSCDSCRRGVTGGCTAVPFMSTYGLGPMGGVHWGGFWSDLVRVPHADAMLVPLPAGVDPATVASASDNIADAYRAVAPRLADRPGAEVLVLGGPAAPSIGLYAAGLAVTLGSARAVYLDTDPERLALAAQLGAEPIEGGPTERVGRFPITVEAAGGSKALVAAIRATANDGYCTSVSVQTTDVALPMLEMYSRCCTFHTGRAHVRPVIPHILELVAAGRFDPSVVTTRTVAWEDSIDALLEGPVKLVATR
ncbi:zinc-dependent alcohol dehydrogenase [Nocardia seriolae]|uniref:Alcohol dehydrogenase n=2 Tax=Nocardia seriolae TaxID=37332 RepID=A0ABC8AVY0_9NOCA|nr:alcohol dehydrogenase catalytic domain-containing protein [Nocardia seriolae]APA98293.1 Alcohol dehydrogenase [Nocardia seriolae]OJF80209.1 dehydrogenase [Nocardia seriolae]PSK29120.1 dehydrogenase [Nocardia seriolae]QOW35848.1 alcohol dehydrogenase catalytic domain-containing protein [Nocardia seriolae]QUN16658.1 alcohol dehydrogenase catalytic domain-containing protein [Nocardia seriolae]